MIVGQKKLLAKLNSFTVDTFPRSSLIIGEKGSGKHLIASYIQSNIIKFNLIDITSNISDELIDNIYRNPNPAVYLINLSEMTEKEQNILLKFIEEPLNNAFIILLAENRNFVLNTVLNRCVVFEMNQYSREELNLFIEESETENKELILNFLRTPGKIKTTNLNNINDIVDVCNKIVNKLSISNYSNALSICDKINYKDEYNKFDLDIFMDCLSYLLFSNYLKTNNRNIYKMYLLTGEQRKKLLDTRLNKQMFMQNFISKLWRESKEV